jgi:hypothetical protein
MATWDFLYLAIMSSKKTSAPNSEHGRYTEIGGVRVKLAPAKRVLPKAEDARIRRAVKDFYAGKKAK